MTMLQIAVAFEDLDSSKIEFLNSQEVPSEINCSPYEAMFGCEAKISFFHKLLEQKLIITIIRRILTNCLCLW